MIPQLKHITPDEYKHRQRKGIELAQSQGKYKSRRTRGEGKNEINYLDKYEGVVSMILAGYTNEDICFHMQVCEQSSEIEDMETCCSRTVDNIRKWLKEKIVWDEPTTKEIIETLDSPPELIYSEVYSICVGSQHLTVEQTTAVRS